MLARIFTDRSGTLHAYRKSLLKYIPAILLLLFFFQSGTAMLQESATWDETHSFGLGEYLLKNMKWNVPGSIIHPPLSYYLSSIPLMFVSNSHDSLWQYDHQKNKGDIEFLGKIDNYRGQMLLSSDVNKNNALLYSSRTITIFITLILGWYIYLWSNSIYGKNAALLSLFFFAFSPNLLAHAHLTTPDMALTTFSFIASFYYWKSLNFCSVKFSIIGGFFFGLALMAKFTSVLLFPIFLGILLLYRIKGIKIDPVNNILFLGTGVFILFLGYGFNITPYIQGITFQLEHAKNGHSSFLMGKYSYSGWWYYYVVAFLIKTPLPTLILIFTVLIYTVSKFDYYKHINEICLLLPVVFIFGFFSIMHQSIGLRYILPIYPFIFVLIGKIAQAKINKKREKLILTLIMAWYLIGTLGVKQHYLAYFNEIIGGPENGYKYLVDSNLDWGQDLPGLKDFMKKNHLNSINLSYFGTDLPGRYGINYNWLPSPLFTDASMENNIRFPVKGLIAISVTNLQGVYLNNKKLYAWLKNCKPIAKIGYSIFIYDIK